VVDALAEVFLEVDVLAAAFLEVDPGKVFPVVDTPAFPVVDTPVFLGVDVVVHKDSVGIVAAFAVDFVVFVAVHTAEAAAVVEPVDFARTRNAISRIAY